VILPSQRISAGLLLLMCFLAGNSAFAQEAHPQDLDSNISERINFIQASFDQGETRAKTWSYSWTGIYGALAGFQTFQTFYKRHDKASNIVGASESLLGLAALIADPFHARSSGKDLREIPEGTPEEQRHKLEMAEKLLERNYKQEKFGRSLPNHLVVLAVNAVGGAIIWHNSGGRDALMSFLSGIAISEAQIWTQPTRAVTDYNDYRSKYKGIQSSIPEKKYFIAPSLNGFVVGVTF